jgi:RimJ/RimL family protein N-acetyltransferase
MPVITQRLPMFPDEEIRTPRVRLRRYRESDVDDHLATFTSPGALRWGTVPQPYTRAHAEAWCAEHAAAARLAGTGINWAAVCRTSGRFLALVSLLNTNWTARVTEVAAMAAPWAAGRALPAETLRALSRWVLLAQGFNRLQITAAVGNRASRLLAASSGFVAEGVLRNAGFTHHGQVDLVMYGLTPGDLARSSSTLAG